MNLVIFLKYIFDTSLKVEIKLILFNSNLNAWTRVAKAKDSSSDLKQVSL